MSHPIDLPAPTSWKRDADGRLVGLMFDSAQPLPAPATYAWLAAVDILAVPAGFHPAASAVIFMRRVTQNALSGP